jgi:phospholipid/cholesterol/gamma-HCH transport system substrate-binding protein
MNETKAPFRYASRRVGALILVTVAIFVAAILQAGVLKGLLEERLDLRVILPESGLAGLNVGAAVEVLGTDAGEVEDLVIDPEQRFHAEIALDPAMEPFVRRDSKVFIRKQFGIAGASYLEITRGQGEPLDWDFAVLAAETGEAPTENVGAILDDVRAKVFPLVEDVHVAVQAARSLLQTLQSPEGNLQRSLASLNAVATRIAQGEGAVGRLVRDDTIVTELESSLGLINRQLTKLDTIMTDLQSTTGNVARLSGTFGEQTDKLPEIIESTEQVLASLDQVMQEVGQTMPALRGLVTDAGTASAALPPLLMQSQQTFSELERLLVQLQGVWLFGGNDGPSTEQTRMSPLEARP